LTGPSGDPGWARLLGAARRSLERTGGSLDATVTLNNPTDDERRLVIGITGVHRSSAAGRLAVRLRDVSEFLHQAYGCTLPDLVAELDGRPVRDRPAERQRERAVRDEILASAAACVHNGQDWFRQWLDSLAADGLLTRFARAGADFGRVVRVLDALPATEEPMPVFAERILGDTKAFHDAALRGLVLRAVARRTGVDNATTAEQERALWESVGVVPDDLASQVLVLNIPATGGVVASWLASAAAAGLPMRITLHQLRHGPLEVTAGEIFVTENPAVLRAASGLGAAAPPVVCTEGIASAAVHRLLGCAPHARLWWRNDFDWPGVRMTAAALARYPNARPWRMSETDYESASGRGPALRGTPAATPWEPGLAEAMRQADRAVMEERLITALLADLRRPPRLDQ
jgi:uncharacterized protein (TIGR02679 family)